jgi:predicted nucleic acid-binding protein
MNYLLDTCVISEYIKKQPNNKVIDWLDEQPETSIFISILTIGELKKGVIKIKNTNLNRYNKLWQWIIQVETRFQDRILPLNQNVINIWAEMCGENEAKGKKLPVMDSLIASTAIEFDLIIVTRNIDDFDSFSVKTFNPWD